MTDTPRPGDAPDPAFDDFVRRHEPRLRAALVLTYGPELGREATAEALAWAWEHWSRAAALDQPVAYLYRVGQSRTRRLRRRRGLPGAPRTAGHDPWVEPGLPSALGQLTEVQRVCTVLVHAYEWHLAEVAELLGVAKSTVQTHVERGLQKLRSELEVAEDG